MSVVLATGGVDHKICFWDAPTGRCTKMIKFPDSQVNKIEITPDKQFIAAAGNPVIRLYEISSSSSPSPAATAAAGGGASAGTPSNPAGASPSDPNHHLQQQQQQPVLTLQGHTNNVTAVGFQKDGRYLYSCSEDCTIKVWDLRNPSYSRSFHAGGAVNSVCLRPDRDEFVSGDQNGCVKIWDLGGNGCINSLTPSAETAGPGKDSGSASRAGKAAAHPHRHQIDHQGVVPIQAVDVSDDSRTLVAISSHGTVFVWDPSRGALGRGHHHHHHPHHPHHHGGGDSFPTGTAPSTPFTEEDGSASGGGGGADALGQSTLLKPVTKFRAHAPGYYCLHGKISPDCRQLVTTGSDGTAKLWDTTTWELTDTLANDMWVWDAAYCADSSYLVTASSDKTARLWNLRTGDVVRKYHGHQSAVTCVALNDSSS